MGSSTDTPPKKEEDNCHSEAIAYVDGSYDDSQKAFAYGIVLFYNGTEKHFARKMSDSNLIDMRNVAGEIKASECAMQFCLDHNIKSLDIYHDYEGIAKWCTGEWKASKTGTQLYKQFYNDIKDHIYIKFFKVKGHSGDKYNDLADQLAKRALFEELEIGEKEMPKSKSVYIDKTSVNDFVINLGRKLWGDKFEFAVINGINFNRFIQVTVESHRLQAKTIKVISDVPTSILEISEKYFKTHKEVIQQSTLPSATKYLLTNA